MELIYSGISFSTTRCNIGPQCYTARSDCSLLSPRTIINAHNSEIKLSINWEGGENSILEMYSDICCKGSQRTHRLCKQFYCVTVAQAYVLETHPASVDHELIMERKRRFSIFSQKRSISSL